MDIDLNLLYEPGYNYRKHPDQQIKNLAKSLETFGQRRTISVWPDGSGKYEVLAGNGITFAARVAGWKTLDCTIAPEGWDSTTRKAYAAADNQGGAEDDQLMLAQLLEEVNNDGRIELEALGSSKEQLQALLDSLGNQMLGEKPGAGGDEFDTTPPPEATRVRPGDLWELGKHRLLCGDSTDAGQVGRLMQGDSLNLIYTDPPYGVSYADKNRFLNAIAPGNRIQEPIANDHATIEEMAKFWKAAFSTMYDAARPGCVVYVSAPQGGDQMMMMMMMMMEAHFPVKHELMWLKNNHVLGRADYAYKHEPILYAWKEGAGHKYYGGFQTSVLEFDKPLKNDLHPTMKPIALIEKLICNSSLDGELVGDWFLGSGTTLIAAERTNRRCYGIEIEPRYCEVILSRWEAETGQTARLVERVENG